MFKSGAAADSRRKGHFAKIAPTVSVARWFINHRHGKFNAEMTRIPLPCEVPYPWVMEPKLGIEFYLR
jgi:hypothetical protein